MKLPTHNSNHRSLPGREGVLLVPLVMAAALMLSACATQHAIGVTPPPLHYPDATPEIADVDVLAVTPAMEEFLERYVMPYQSLETRLDMLTVAVVENGVLGFEYENDRTKTAVETFNNRSGNCISHANMVVALARRAGLNAYFQEVATRPQWINRENTYMVNRHVNVVLTSPHNSMHVDISGIRPGEQLTRRVLSDRDAKALYFSNRGAEALIENDLSTAYANLVKAIRVAPYLSGPWVNLGVVYSRNNQLSDAELAHKTALRLDPGEASAMTDLYLVYKAQGRFEAAEQLRRRVEKHRRKNPYYLLMLSNEALKQSRLDESVSLLKRAIKKKDDDHRLHFALARSLYLSGKRTAAERRLIKAREIAPKDAIIDYSLPLDQLMNQQ